MLILLVEAPEKDYNTLTCADTASAIPLLLSSELQDSVMTSEDESLVPEAIYRTGQRS